MRNNLKFKSPIYEIVEIESTTTTPFYKSFKVGTRLMFEFETDALRKTTIVVIHDLKRNKAISTPANRLLMVLDKFKLREIEQ